MGEHGRHSKVEFGGLIPRVTVITGYYNRGHALLPTVSSILNQTFSDLELIVFDDASSDGTADQLLEAEREFGDPRLKVRIHEVNRGFTQCMIDAIASSDSEYVAVQGSGDISHPERIAKQVALLDARSDVGVVGCWYRNIVSGTSMVRPRRPDASKKDFEGLLQGNVFSHGEVMFRRRLYEEVGGYRLAFSKSQDYDLWLRMAKVSRLATVPEYLYDRYVRFDGASYAPSKFALQARYSLLARRFAEDDANGKEVQLTRLQNDGPMALVDESDPDLQRRLVKGALRSIVWGAPSAASAIAKASIANVPMGYLVRGLAALSGSVVAYPILALARRALGVQNDPSLDGASPDPHVPRRSAWER